ncbi:histidine kinase [Aliiroseovarius crassostreae]|uniref:Histidine kinase n=1 Tax=Aliiroseovarius crassostreae TaxID=154981 RepID=A0A9Q9HA72_9RHOB|nr:DUF6446 family protein [Aliiroseovarius crassostreae]UWP88267.1 histidine kinase [Aliiroseovarius crassostreae]UWP91426.1 histidine kinase [Aliiroseovarius crassostreae]UWP94602.1 histidine kinase [Aliiroseovarius crassostreae]UWP97745.1 histidine kinase [Aliiroseovarius crassostreae]
MSGKLLGIMIIASSLIFGAVVYYTQLYAFYEPAAADTELRMINVVTGQPETVIYDQFDGIDSDSSPLRFRGCFTTTMSLAMLTETFEVYDRATPLVAPGWFDCFDAQAIGYALEEGDAIAFLGEKNIKDGVDRVIAIFPDGRGYTWHQLNEKYDD